MTRSLKLFLLSIVAVIAAAMIFSTFNLLKSVETFITQTLILMTLFHAIRAAENTQ